MKEKQSKLDPFASQIEYWFGTEKKTLKEVAAQLALDGCKVSEQRLSEWWSARSDKLMRDKILNQITSGARQVKDVEKQFASDPPPELEMLIKLHRTLILKLTTEANVNPELFEFVTYMMKPVMKWAELQEKKASRELDETKFQFSAATACLKQLASLKVISTDKTLTEPQKVEQIRLKLFGTLPKAATT